MAERQPQLRKRVVLVAVKTTLAWKYKNVKLTDLPQDVQRKLLEVAKGQVTQAQLKALGISAMQADLEKLRKVHGEFVLSHSPWGLAQFRRILGGRK